MLARRGASLTPQPAHPMGTDTQGRAAGPGGAGTSPFRWGQEPRRGRGCSQGHLRQHQAGGPPRHAARGGAGHPQSPRSAGAGALHPHMPRSPGWAGPARGGRCKGDRGSARPQPQQEQGAKVFPAAGAAVPDPAPRGARATMEGCGSGWGGGDRAVSSRGQGEWGCAEAGEGQGPCGGVGAAWPQAGAALGLHGQRASGSPVAKRWVLGVLVQTERGGLLLAPTAEPALT